MVTSAVADTVWDTVRERPRALDLPAHTISRRCLHHISTALSLESPLKHSEARDKDSMSEDPTPLLPAVVFLSLLLLLSSWGGRSATTAPSSPTTANRRSTTVETNCYHSLGAGDSETR